MFRAIVITHQDNQYRATYCDVSDKELPAGDVTVEVDYSSINYKDALAITGRAPIVRHFPMIPGIDFAGTVIESTHARFRLGEPVLLTGWGVGERYWGGLARNARVSGEWLTPIPAGSDARHVMAIGTAGFTAMLAVQALHQHGIQPSDGPVLVTGASGGVGGCAIIILAAMGYQVIASTGRPEQNGAQLSALGASEVIDRTELSVPGKPLQKERWVAAIDTVGSVTLANVCAGTGYGGIVAACGMAQGLDFPSSVAPFILRGVTLCGIDSVMVPAVRRPAIWQQACQHLTPEKLDRITRVLPLSQAIAAAEALLSGDSHGRTVIDCR